MIIDSMPSNDFPHAHNGTRNKSYAVILRVVVNVRLCVDLSTILFSCSIKERGPEFFCCRLFWAVSSAETATMDLPFLPLQSYLLAVHMTGTYSLIPVSEGGGGAGCGLGRVQRF
jgi:hypothetical protein